MARSFYEDDELVITKPGFNTEISQELKAKESLHGDVSFSDGMVIRSTPFLEQKMNKLRLYTHDKYLLVAAELNTIVSAVTNEVNFVGSEVSSVTKEPVLPNLTYILTATLTGSILVNRRMLPIRFFTPALLGIGTYYWFMPKSFYASGTKLVAYEAEKFPNFYAQQTKVINWTKYQYHAFIKGYYNFKQDLTSSVHTGRMALIEQSEKDKSEKK